MPDSRPDAPDARQLAQTLDFCLRVGEVLLSSGAGAADVTATMRAVAQSLGVRNPQVDVTFTSLAMSVQTLPDDPPVLQIRSVNQREIDYEDLTRVDHLVRDVVAGRVELTDARRGSRGSCPRGMPGTGGRRPLAGA